MLEQVTLEVVGENKLHCAGCERTVKFTLAQLPGVTDVQADHKTQRIEVSLESDETDIEKITTELDWIGYQVAPE